MRLTPPVCERTRTKDFTLLLFCRSESFPVMNFFRRKFLLFTRTEELEILLLILNQQHFSNIKREADREESEIFQDDESRLAWDIIKLVGWVSGRMLRLVLCEKYLRWISNTRLGKEVEFKWRSLNSFDFNVGSLRCFKLLSHELLTHKNGSKKNHWQTEAN